MTFRDTRVYSKVRKSTRAIEYDRETWAGNTLYTVSYDTYGSGVIETELLDFGIVFEDEPNFSYGVEAQPGQVLSVGDYPLVTAGVTRWEITQSDGEGSLAEVLPFYLGAYVWINVVSTNAYRLRFRLSFEGIAMRNVEYFRGT